MLYNYCEVLVDTITAQKSVGIIVINEQRLQKQSPSFILFYLTVFDINSFKTLLDSKIRSWSFLGSENVIFTTL